MFFCFNFILVILVLKSTFICFICWIFFTRQMCLLYLIVYLFKCLFFLYYDNYNLFVKWQTSHFLWTLILWTHFSYYLSDLQRMEHSRRWWWRSNVRANRRPSWAATDINWQGRSTTMPLSRPCPRGDLTEEWLSSAETHRYSTKL